MASYTEASNSYAYLRVRATAGTTTRAQSSDADGKPAFNVTIRIGAQAKAANSNYLYFRIGQDSDGVAAFTSSQSISDVATYKKVSTNKDSFVSAGISRSISRIALGSFDKAVTAYVSVEGYWVCGYASKNGSTNVGSLLKPQFPTGNTIPISLPRGTVSVKLYRNTPIGLADSDITLPTWTSSHYKGDSINPADAVDTTGTYNFTGWYYDSACTNPATLPFTLDITPINLYAGWEEATVKPLKVKINGAWYDSEVYVKDNGAWESASNAYVKINGAWEESTT